jgi:3-hydroxyisobutyrate dehydrogenase-like beta-hydroxyacid dehydrogenase
LTAGMQALRPTVGIIGLGTIGDGIARNLHSAGFPLVVCDVRAEATADHGTHATIAASPAELARLSDVVIVAVVNDRQVYSVLTESSGAFAASDKNTTFIIVSTITKQCVEAVGAEAAARGVPIVDCGVSGGPSAAASGNLVCMCGGDPDVIAGLDPVLDAMGSLTVTMGPFGTGLAAKLARNLIQLGGWLAAYEGQLLAEAAGIKLNKLAQVVRAADAQSGGITALMFRPTVAPFSETDDRGLLDAMKSAAALSHKDVQAALALAEDLGIELPLGVMADARCDTIFGVGQTS